MELHHVLAQARADAVEWERSRGRVVIGLDPTAATAHGLFGLTPILVRVFLQ